MASVSPSCWLQSTNAQQLAQRPGQRGTNPQRVVAASDLEAARAYASTNFRYGVSVEQFDRIIERNYAFPLDDPDVTFVDFSRRGDSTILRVDVAGSPITRSWTTGWGWKTTVGSSTQHPLPALGNPSRLDHLRPARAESASLECCHRAQAGVGFRY